MAGLPYHNRASPKDRDSAISTVAKFAVENGKPGTTMA